MIVRVTLSLLVLSLAAFSCKETPPEPIQHIPALELTIEDAQVTEAWLHLKFTDAGAPRGFTLWRDGTQILSGTLPTQDTILVDGGLLPNHSYSYRAFRLAGTTVTDSSKVIQVTSMDTTSHAISWQTFALGDPASSALYDVAIVNDTLVYAVGELYLRDSSGNWDPDAYNMVAWNGKKCQLLRIPFIGPCSAVLHPPLRAIFALSDSSILLSNGGSIVKYDGESAIMDCGMNSLLTGAITKIWAVSPEQVLLVGNTGTIVEYAGGSWQKLASGTTLDFHDIWGATNPKTGELEVLAVASDPFGTHEKKIAKISGTTVTSISDSGVSESVSTVWFVPGSRYYMAGSGPQSALYDKHVLTDAVWRNDVSSTFHFYVFSIRGSAVNDVFTCGGYGEVVHYNGLTYENYSAMTAVSGNYFSIAVKGSLVVAVGDGRGGMIAIGKR